MTRTAATLAVSLSLLVLSACGSSSPSDPRAARPGGYDACTVADVSGSTVKARGLYVGAFERFVTEAGTHGSGTVCLVLAAGDPQAEGTPMSTSVAPQHRGNKAYAAAEVAAAAKTATAQFSQLLQHPPVARGGSAVLEAAAMTAPMLHEGDRLLIASDGIQSSDLSGDFHDVDLSRAGVTRLLDRLHGAGLLPNLGGVLVVMPLLLAHPGGTNLSQQREAMIRQFWQAWAVRTGADLRLTNAS